MGVFGRPTLEGIAVESTFNWYWLVDGLMEAGFQVHLANTARMQEYGGLKYTDDHHDARWLAHMLRLGILPQGYIYPAQERAVRDLLRKRGQLVRQRTVQILSLQNLLSRNLGQQLSGNRIKGLDEQALSELLPVAEQHLAAGANLAVMRALDGQIEHLEQEIKARVKPRPALKWLKTVAGIGDILGWTILLEAGDIARFAHVGNYASYCRCVESKRLSNGKKKGENNRKNGNKYAGLKPTWRRPTSPSATTTRSRVSTSARRPRPTVSSPSRRWRTSLRGPATILSPADGGTTDLGRSAITA
jgi:transposase